MNNNISLPPDANTRFHMPVMARRRFIEEVFAVKEPSCPVCRHVMDFSIFENFEGSGVDWIQWRCTGGCGFLKNVEIL